MEFPRGQFLYLAAVAAALAAACGPSVAQNWPQRPLTMVVPLAAGSALDSVGRILAPRLSELLGQQVIVENVAGAGGMVGAARVAKASPDGYQFVLGTVGTHAHSQTLYKKPLYDAATDFMPVALITDFPVALIVRRELPVSDLPEFITYAKVNQSRMQYGSPGAGSAAHLACALLNVAIGVKVTHVPYRGGAQAMQDLIADRIDYYCAPVSIAFPQIENKMAKAIAIVTKDRSALLPALATAHEQGLANFQAGNWVALFLPRDTPAPIAQILRNAAVATMDTPSVQERLSNIGAPVVAPERRTPEYLQIFVVSEVERWAAAIKAAGVSLD